MRLIDADALRECYEDLDDNLKVPILICKANIDSMPTIKPKHGRWVIQNGRWHCSECGMKGYKYPYCPNCGAKMEV